MTTSRETLMDRCLAGLEPDPDGAIDDRLGRWHDGDGEGLPIDEYLGMTHGEYAAWAEGRKSVREIVRERRP